MYEMGEGIWHWGNSLPLVYGYKYRFDDGG